MQLHLQQIPGNDVLYCLHCVCCSASAYRLLSVCSSQSDYKWAQCYNHKYRPWKLWSQVSPWSDRCCHSEYTAIIFNFVNSHLLSNLLQIGNHKSWHTARSLCAEMEYNDGQSVLAQCCWSVEVEWWHTFALFKTCDSSSSRYLGLWLRIFWHVN